MKVDYSHYLHTVPMGQQNTALAGTWEGTSQARVAGRVYIYSTLEASYVYICKYSA